MPSFILSNWKDSLVQYVLKEINTCTYFRSSTFRKQFMSDFKLNENLTRSISIRIGRISKELIELGILEYYNKTHKKVYKNLFKGTLFETLNKKMNENYTIIKIKSKV